MRTVSVPRRGFTLVELLVVIAIIGILVALLLPAVQAARDAARRMENSNNLKQIGIAVANYEESFEAYPPMRYAAVSPANWASDNKTVSWAFRLLPFMEQQVVYDKWDNVQVCSHANNTSAMRTPLKVYTNPRRRKPLAECTFVDASTTKGTCIDYAASRGFFDAAAPYSHTGNKYQQAFNGDRCGPFGHDFAVPHAAVRDGTSNTISVGDRWIPTTSPADNCGLSGNSEVTIQRGAEVGFPTGPTDTNNDKFGSPSGSTAAFVFLDGHVQWISYSIANDTFRWLCTVADGKVIPGDAF